MWIVAGNPGIYPWVDEYETYDEAKKAFDEAEAEKQETIYLAEVIKSKTLEQEG